MREKTQRLKRAARVRKKRHIRKKITGTSERPRLAIHRSLKHIYAMLIDDAANKTLGTVSSLSKELADDVAKAKSKTDVGKAVGQAIAARAKALKIKRVVFDRSGYLYHGRVKAVADGAREGGLEF